MSERCSDSQAIFRLSKMFIVQYVYTVQGWGAFQEGAVDLLAWYMVKMMKGLALQVKKVCDMQGRTLGNPLHLLVVVHQLQCLDFQELLHFISGRRNYKYKQFEVLRRCMDRILRNDVPTINRSPPCTQYSNIRYLPKVYTVDLDKKALPYRHPLCDTVPKPQEIPYKSTQSILQRQVNNIETLQAYQRRENKRALLGFEKRKARQRAVSNTIQSKDNIKHPHLLIKDKDIPYTESSPNIYISKDETNLNVNNIDKRIDEQEQQNKIFKVVHEQESAEKIVHSQKYSDQYVSTPQKMPSVLSDLTKSKSRHSEISNEWEYNSMHRSLTLYGRQIIEFGKNLGDEEAPRTGKKNKFDFISYL